MTILNKALIGACVVLTLTVIYLGREQVMPAGPRNVMTMVRSPWTGRVYLCAPYGGECRQTYPPLDAPNRGSEDDAVNTAEVVSDKGAGPPPELVSIGLKLPPASAQPSAAAPSRQAVPARAQGWPVDLTPSLSADDEPSDVSRLPPAQRDEGDYRPDPRLSDQPGAPVPDIRALIERSRKIGMSDDEIRAQMERSPYLADTWKKSDAAGIARSDVFAHFGLKPSTAIDGRPDDGRKMLTDRSDKMKWCRELPGKVPYNGEIFKRLGFGPNQALVVNNGDTDAVAKFRDSLGTVVASIFIGSCSEAKIDDFPDGSYQLQFATGTGWSRRCGLFEVVPIGWTGTGVT